MPDEVATLIAGRDALGHATFVARDDKVPGFASYAQFRGGAGSAA